MFLARTGKNKQTRDLFNILPTKLNTLLRPLLYLFQATQKSQNLVRSTRKPGKQRSSLRTKNGDFQFFQSNQQVVAREGQVR